MLLEVKNLTKRFGGFTAVANVDLAVRPGEVRGIIGPTAGQYTRQPDSRLYKPKPAPASSSTPASLHGRMKSPARLPAFLCFASSIADVTRTSFGHHAMIRTTPSAVTDRGFVFLEGSRVRAEMTELSLHLPCRLRLNAAGELSGGQAGSGSVRHGGMPKLLIRDLPPVCLRQCLHLLDTVGLQQRFC